MRLSWADPLTAVQWIKFVWLEAYALLAINVRVGRTRSSIDRGHSAISHDPAYLSANTEEIFDDYCSAKAPFTVCLGREEVQKHIIQYVRILHQAHGEPGTASSNMDLSCPRLIKTRE